jgi:hypothetical protein
MQTTERVQTTDLSELSVRTEMPIAMARVEIRSMCSRPC